MNINLSQFSIIHRNHYPTHFSNPYFECIDYLRRILAANERSDFIALLYFPASSAIVLSKHPKAETQPWSLGSVSNTFF